MYSEQLLIKLEANTLNQLKKMAQAVGLKLSSFARMILKNFAEKKKKLTTEEMEDIIDTHLVTQAMKKKNPQWYKWEDVEKEIFDRKVDEYGNYIRTRGKAKFKKTKR